MLFNAYFIYMIDFIGLIDSFTKNGHINISILTKVIFSGKIFSNTGIKQTEYINRLKGGFFLPIIYSCQRAQPKKITFDCVSKL